MSRFMIGHHTIGTDRCFVIAEIGVNHNGDVSVARQLVDAALGAGADAVKFQAFKADTLAAADAPKAAYQATQTGPDESQHDMIRRLELEPQALQQIADYCRDKGLIFFATPFDASSAEDLIKLQVPVFKVGSGDLTNIPLLRHLARTGRPMIVSTGMSYLGEVEAAVNAIRSCGCEDLALLHCVSSYPADPADTNLRALDTLHAAFGVPVGLSDHTLGTTIPFAAVARGATIVEKHLTLDRNLPGPDQAASLEPQEFAHMMEGIREIEAALGDGIKRPRPSEADTRNVARRSLHVARDIRQGETIGTADLTVLRPSGGIGPEDIDRVAGSRARRDLQCGERLHWQHLDVVAATNMSGPPGLPSP